MQRTYLPTAIRYAVVLGFLAAPAFCQTNTINDITTSLADRGFYPGGSYSLSDIESVNTVNGNVNLTFPLAGLPPGRAGMSAGLKLHYNSAIYDLSFQVVSDAGAPALKQDYVPSVTGGGWSYGIAYGLLTETRPELESFDCNVDTEFRYLYRTYLLMPDGGRKVLALQGAGASPQGDQFYGIDELLNTAPCPGAVLPTDTSKLVYYTTDGSQIRIEVTPAQRTWKAFLSDGTTVAGIIGGAAPNATTLVQTVCDRNQNCVKLQAICSDSAVECEQDLVDDLGREIRIVSDAGEDKIYALGYGAATNPSPGVTAGAVETDVTWAPHSVTRDYFCVGTDIICTGVGLGSTVVTSITLPKAQASSPQLSYQFNYDCSSCTNWGELHSMTLPSGAQVAYSYRWDSVDTLARPAGAIDNPLATKTLTYNDGSENPPETTIYSINPGTGPNSITHPDGGVTTYYFLPRYSTDFRAGLVYKTVEPDGTTTEREWKQNIPYGMPALTFQGNPYAALEITSFSNAVLSAKRFRRDKNGNLLSEEEFDLSPSAVQRDANGLLLDLPAGVTPVRTTQNVYAAATGSAESGADESSGYWNTTAPSYLQAVTATRTCSPGSTSYDCTSSGATIAAASEFGYDNALTTANRTSETRWDSELRAYSSPLGAQNAVTSTFTYDSHGNLTTQYDGRGTETLIAHDSQELYVTSITEAVGFPEQRITQYSYDFASGVLTGKTTADQLQTAYSYDWLNRPVSETQPGRQTTINYDDLNRSITTLRNQDAQHQLAAVYRYDSLGRLMQTEAPGGIVTDRRQRAGSGVDYQLVSNPYCTVGTASCPSAPTGWQVTTLDSGGKPVRVEHFAGSSRPGPWGGNGSSTGWSQTSYTGRSTTVTDEAGHSRTLTRDGLGRLSAVVEDPAGLALNTSYTYDILDNLHSGPQGRQFSYDSLSHLVTAANPESGSIGYTYDAAGNVQTRLQAGVTTTYTYDRLNQVRNKTYSDGTPAATYTYDPVGRIASAAANGVSSTSYGYDGLGRVLSQTQTTQGVAYPFSYTHDLADGLTSVTYPSQRVISYSYLPGVEWVQGVSGQAHTGAPVTPYASSIAWGPQGAVASLTLGNNVAESWQYNERLQVQQITAGALWTLQYDYGTANNGDVRHQTISLPGGTTLYQGYSYDALDRLQTASERTSANPAPQCPDSGSEWCEQYSYDPWGNRLIAQRTNLTAGLEEPAAYNGANNRMLTGQLGGSFGYDARGNLSQSPEGATYAYDAENRMVAYCPQGGTCSAGAAGATGYGYDGEGRRVTKTSGGATTVYVYDAEGELAAEYGGTETAVGVQYVTVDALGSVRLVTDGSGAVVERKDYLPYGEELLVGGTSARHGIAGYGAEAGVTQKFTGKERDQETGLDYFGARYLSGAQGRYTTADEPLDDQKANNPQSWNLYVYARNNPLRFLDPTGRECVTLDSGAVGDNGVGQPCQDKGLQTTHGVTVNGTTGEVTSSVFGNALLMGDIDLSGGKDRISSQTAEIVSTAVNLKTFVGLAKVGLTLGPLVLAMAKSTPAEKLIIEELLAAGKTVEVIPTGTGRTADFLINGAPTELKTLTSAGPTTLKNAVQNAAKQGEQILVDARNVNMSPQEALNQIQRAQGNIGGLQGRVTVLTKGGTVTY